MGRTQTGKREPKEKEKVIVPADSKKKENKK